MSKRWFIPRRDPSNAMELAIRSLRLLGILSVVIGAAVMLVLGIANRYTLYRPYFLAAGAMVWLAPGVVYLVSIALLRRGKLAGLVVSLASAGLQTVFAAGFVIAQLFLRPITLVPLLLSVLWLAAVIELLVQLRYSFTHLRFKAMEQQPAFPVVPIPPAPPPPTTTLPPT